MAVVLASRVTTPRESPRSFSLQAPINAVGHFSPPTPSLRTSRTDHDLGLDGFDFSYFDAKASLGGLADEAEPEAARTLDVQHRGGTKPSDAVIPSVESDGEGNHNISGIALAGPKPFQKWMRSLHKRATRSIPAHVDLDDSPEDPSDLGSEHSRPRLVTRKSSAGSSFAFVTAVHSASISLASASFMAPRRRRMARSSHGWTERSSRASTPAPRFSEDSYFEGANLPDDEVVERSLQRRRILEELLSTEANYIGDVKFLMNVYITILASLPTQHDGLRQSINTNLTEIVELHQEMLGELHRAVPCSEFPPAEAQARVRHSSLAPTRLHHRWHSLDSVDEHRGGKTKSQDTSSMTADPEVAAEVARIFGHRIQRFFVYEEYGAKYEMMIKDVASANHAMPGWESYQRGLEALAASLGSKHQHLDDSKKALTLADLLVKPIQRVCRYPLLFSELLKYTPACDCPDSQMDIEGVLFRLREATSEINRATDDPDVKASLERTWLIQDRLVYPAQSLNAASKSMIRSFGQVLLCGALYVCWQTCDAVEGEYMISLLYKERLCLAVSERGDQKYTIRLCISLNSVRVEEVDNGRGEMDQKNDTAGTIARRVSIQRATTVGSKSALCQVVLKNTTTVKDSSQASSISTISRSQSLQTTNPRNTLAPAVAERARLEAVLADVWSRGSLPFPGMTSRSRSEQLVRSSASTVMRKLSVASISSSFTKKSVAAGPIGRNQDGRAVPRTSYSEHNSAHRADVDFAETKLPIIKDEYERSNSSLPRAPLYGANNENDTGPGSIRRFKLARSYEVLQRGEQLLTLGSPILRTASINSARPESLSMKSLSTCVSEKDVVVEGSQVPTLPATSRPGKKWARVKTINRGFKASSLRSLFR
ncbi:RhoGEF domain-containing protein [Microdochium nivale]|nr:RhoGEF domain-containing protein [Microdochium nivale]